ncbi:MULTISPECIES: TRAP transporter small permease [Halomonas]|uniref:TRAP transporter small permease n=1 Tax=Halomonas TaxID=2745 RepID=UPI001C93D192|nr:MULTISPECIES: TRAP transporter small permease [Halomonas]MED5296122.1 TRAP transporter small permease [Pseudomonadota bacterium]MBY5928742.1 TRAP transporter small permease [Halomonas sp. DP8Y7-3]MBY6031091.1 TRAP transporter small permease [Halomonas sp. DP8Y7-1]MBY6206217.1 TRAP transporter small permease [Halomonas sp. DP3Y7-2]MBY6227892.1 TRAP transporter small permease [Halomonas sp. DP3Y7-1]
MSPHDSLASRWSHTLDRWVERCCVILLAALVITVWVGILARYVLPWNLTFTEELARYLMIWVALLAISIGICRRQHVGMLVLFDRLPLSAKRFLALAFDLVGIAFFAVMFVYSLTYVERGFSQSTMIFGVAKGYPYLIIPIASGVACLQLALAAIRDLQRSAPQPALDRS